MSKAKMRRTLAQYEGCSPDAIASGSKAQMMYFVEDAKADIATLAEDRDRLARNRDMWKGQVERQAEQLAERSWRPIETAPMDGTDILITTAGHGMLVRVGFWDAARDGVWSIWPGRDRMIPTHWQPLPKCPSTLSRNDAGGGK